MTFSRAAQKSLQAHRVTLASNARVTYPGTMTTPLSPKELTFEEHLKDPNNAQAHTLEEWRVVNLTTGQVVWSRPRNPVMEVGSSKPQWVYQPALVDELCQAIVEGGSLTLLCDGKKFPPYAQFCRWRRLHPEINEQLEQARRDRAERMRDLAIQEAMQATNKSDSVAAQVRFTALKWASGLDDPRYKDSNKVDVAVSSPNIIQVVTGIERKEDVEPRTVQEIHAKSKDTQKSE